MTYAPGELARTGVRGAIWQGLAFAPCRRDDGLIGMPADDILGLPAEQALGGGIPVGEAEGSVVHHARHRHPRELQLELVEQQIAFVAQATLGLITAAAL